MSSLVKLLSIILVPIIVIAILVGVGIIYIMTKSSQRGEIGAQPGAQINRMLIQEPSPGARRTLTDAEWQQVQKKRAAMAAAAKNYKQTPRQWLKKKRQHKATAASSGGGAKTASSDKIVARYPITTEQHIFVVFNSPKQKQYINYMEMILFGSCDEAEKAKRNGIRTYYFEDAHMDCLEKDIETCINLPILVYATYCPNPRLCFDYDRYLDVYKACLTKRVSYTFFILKRGVNPQPTDINGSRDMVMTYAGVPLPSDIFTWKLRDDVNYDRFDEDNKDALKSLSNWMRQVIMEDISKAPTAEPIPVVADEPKKVPPQVSSGGGGASFDKKKSEQDECGNEPIEYFEKHEYLQTDKEKQLADALGWKNPMHIGEVVPAEEYSTMIFSATSLTYHPDKTKDHSPHTIEMSEKDFNILNHVNDLLIAYRDLTEEEIPLAIKLGWVSETDRRPLSEAPDSEVVKTVFNLLLDRIQGNSSEQNKERRVLCQAFRKYCLHYNLMSRYKKFMKWLTTDTGSWFVFYPPFIEE